MSNRFKFGLHRSLNHKVCYVYERNACTALCRCGWTARFEGQFGSLLAFQAHSEHEAAALGR